MLLSSSIRCKVKIICRLLRIENTRLKLRYCRRRWGLGKFLLKISDTYIASLKRHAEQVDQTHLNFSPHFY